MIIAIGIMVILLAIALTFFTVTKLELRTATNVSNTVRADQLSDAANAIAAHTLNTEFQRHPNYTSTDHAWRTFFNGAAFAGKNWAIRGGKTLAGRNTPQIDMTRFENLYARFEDGYVEPLYRGARTRDWLFIPRWEQTPDGTSAPVLYPEGGGKKFLQLEQANDDGTFTVVDNPAALGFMAPDSLQTLELFHPFVTPDYYGVPVADGQPVLGGEFRYPIEQVNTWADVDNDGDGLKDSLWIPIPADIFYPLDQIDNNLNGLLDERQDNIFAEGGDEDRDGYIGTFADCEDPSYQSCIPTGEFDPDEALEAGVFVYNGMGPPIDPENGDFSRVGDGLDNDGDGDVDEPDENRLFLTAPLPGIWMLVDLNADGMAGDTVVNAVTGKAEILRVRLPNRIRIPVRSTYSDREGSGIPYRDLGPEHVDKIDNDYDGYINNYNSYAYIGPNTFDDARGHFPFRAKLNVVNNECFLTPLNTAYNSYADFQDPYYVAGWRLPGNWYDKDDELFSTARARAYADIATDSVFDGGADALEFSPSSAIFRITTTNELVTYEMKTILANSIRITHSGEPNCELAGRAAILIVDEASKVNMNSAGGHVYNEWPKPIRSGVYEGRLVRAMNQGATPYEYETRMLPQIGVTLSARMWGLLTGSPQGLVFPPFIAGAGSMPAANTLLGDLIDQGCIYRPPYIDYAYDVCLPGYGRVDDNANALLLCFNGRDDDGDGMIDEGVNPAYPAYLGLFEGIDEPGELQRGAALRNFLAETDGNNNEYYGNDDLTCPGQADEIGELGDRQLNKPEDILLAAGIGEKTYGYIKNLITVFSTDRNVEFMQDEDGRQRTFNRLDFNHATAQQIASGMLLSQAIRRATDNAAAGAEGDDVMHFVSFDPALPYDRSVLHYAEGLRQNGLSLGGVRPDGSNAPISAGFMHFRDNGGDIVPLTGNLPADGVVTTMQLAVNAVDNRDIDCSRTVLATENINANPDAAAAVGYTPWPAPDELNARETITSEMKFPVHEVQNELVRTMGETERTLDSTDEWWGALVKKTDPVSGAVTKEERQISYTAAGTEAIRINELMVRPVRRIEAEAITHAVPGGPGNPNVTLRTSLLDLQVSDPNVFLQLMNNASLNNYYRNYFPTPNVYPHQPIGLPDFDIQEKRMGVDVDSDTGAIIEDEMWSEPRVEYNSVGSNAAFSTFEQGDIIQFVIRATDLGLPEGRYYLAVNTTDKRGVPTVKNPGDMEYAIKYVNVETDGTPVTGSTILDDIRSQMVADDAVATQQNLDEYFAQNWASIAAYQISHNPGAPEGWVFIDGTPNRSVSNFLSTDFAPDTDYYSDGGGVAAWESLPGNPPTHTVTIPPITSDMALCIAFRNKKITNPDVIANPANPPDPDNPVNDPDNLYRFAINFLDFSQEPDHEWVEVTNTSDVAIDMSGWQLEIGIPDPANAAGSTMRPTDTFKSLWTVPAGTTIAPRGNLLFSFETAKEDDPTEPSVSKFDLYQTDITQTDVLGNPLFSSEPHLTLLNTNGIGLAGGESDFAVIFPDIAGVTIPFFADQSSDYAGYPNLYAVDELYDRTGSVFQRNLDLTNDRQNWFTDYVDNNGDGVTSVYLLQRGLAALGLPPDADARTDHAELENETVSTPNDMPGNWNDDFTAAQWGEDFPDNWDGAKPWDRIVSLKNESIWCKDPRNPKSEKVDLYNALDAAVSGDASLRNLARIVLQGGFLPNYPEHDGIDNDGDGGYLLWCENSGIGLPCVDVNGDGVIDNDDVVPVQYVPGSLDKDMVDNDLDGFIDERGDGWDVDQDGFILAADGDIPFNPAMSEGVDEGRNVFAGEFAPGVLPITFLNDRGAYPIPEQWSLLESAATVDGIAPYDYWMDSQEFDSLSETVAAGDMTDADVWELSSLGVGWSVGVFGETLFADEATGEVFQEPNDPEVIPYVVNGDIIPLVNGARYQVRYEIIGPIDGFVRIVLGDDDSGLLNKSPQRDAPGVYVDELTCEVLSHAVVRIVATDDTATASPGLTCTIDNLSVTRVDNFWKAVDARYYPAASAEDDGLVTRMGDLEEDQTFPVVEQFGVNNDALYLGSDDDPIDWKAFAERRFYPGDNVTVTLYEGPALNGKVADRVTYREFDVTNRTIDDMVDCRYSVDDGAGGTETACLHPDYPSFWLPDQMALDFYRSLERKHPLYAGDRFGTSNRWEATDGNYDDWADSLSVMTSAILAESYPYTTGYQSVESSLWNRFNAGTNDEVRDTLRLLGHGLFGSPLRMNTVARLMENPPDLVRLVAGKFGISVPESGLNARPESQFCASNDMGLAIANGYNEKVRAMNADWALGELSVRNQAFRSSGDLAHLPLLTQQHLLMPPAVNGGEPFLYDMTHVNYGFYPDFLHMDEEPVHYQDAALRGTMLAQSNDPVVPWVTESVDAMAQNPIILTMGQADFTPIRPNPNTNTAWMDTPLVYPNGNFSQLVRWKLEGGRINAPGAWMPVFLFGFAGDALAMGKTIRQFPNYPPFPEGYNATPLVGNFPLCYLYNAEYIFGKGGGAAFAGVLDRSEVALRWPLEKRVVMYVSEVRDTVNLEHRPEALFAWDADDGLENGEYCLYVGTYIPGLADTLQNPDGTVITDTTTGEPFLAKGTVDAFTPDLLGDLELNTDEPRFAPRLAIDVITDRTRAQGQAPKGSGSDVPGLVHPSDWNPDNVYIPGLDGLVLYGSEGADSWKPRIVRVTDNFLAVRVRNVGFPGQVAALTHVVLSPRKRHPGKLNINTVQDRVVRAGSNPIKDELFNPLMGLPGVVDALTTVTRHAEENNILVWKPIGGKYAPDEDIDPPTVNLPPGSTLTSPKWTEPDVFAELFGKDSMVPAINETTDNYASASDFLADASGQEELAAQRLSALIMSLRTKHHDARYYETPVRLIQDTTFEPGVPNIPVFKPLSNDVSDQRRYDEAIERFSRMANMITVRSDVFQVVATVQAGYGMDYNGDGFFDYRGQEFVTTAETKSRMVYERRTPALASDQAIKK